MKFRMTRVIGNITFVFEDEAQKDMDFFKKAGFYAALPSQCGNCESKNIYPDYRKTKDGGFEYGSLNCHQCGHQYKFGQYKDRPGFMFPKENEGWTEIPVGNPANIGKED